jgi:hypothetical protein
LSRCPGGFGSNSVPSVANKRRWWSLAIGLGMALAVAFPVAATAAPARETAEIAATTRLQKDSPDKLCLAAFSRDVGSPAVQWSCAGPTEPTQLWEFIGPYYVQQGGNYYLMRNKYSGLCLTIEQEVAGEPVLQQPCSTVEPPPNHQSWGITSGDFQLILPRIRPTLYLGLSGSLSGQAAALSTSWTKYLFLDEAPEFG